MRMERVKKGGQYPARTVLLAQGLVATRQEYRGTLLYRQRSGLVSASEEWSSTRPDSTAASSLMTVSVIS